jgi:hypothetical protein
MNMRNYRNSLGLAAIAAFVTFALPLLSGSALAQQRSLKEQIVGTWTITQCDWANPDGTKRPLVVGNNPVGQFIFTNNGRFSFQVTADIPKWASGGDYRKTTPEENKAVVEGTMSYFGTYTAVDNTIALHIERSSIPNLNGTDGRRIVNAVSADEMNWTNPGPLGGGSMTCSNKRIQ